ncbi:uncharacterized protein LOC135492258 [Lineus longissimus]|uniref:uncharacterized protein LOC135492258 n=1 Tax=Lineus longissimus TaxID=88925 RepID=UPI002B4CDCE7
MLRVTEKPRPGCIKRELSASQKVSKKYLKAHMKRLHKKEYRKLREMVPAVAHKDKVSKVTVIEEAIKYIDELHAALIERLQAGTTGRLQQGSSPNQAEINQRMLHEMVLRNLQPLHTIKVNPLCEKQRKVATYLRKTDKLPKRDL